MRILVGSPKNIITSVIAADPASHPSVKGSAKSLGTVARSITTSFGLLFLILIL